MRGLFAVDLCGARKFSLGVSHCSKVALFLAAKSGFLLVGETDDAFGLCDGGRRDDVELVWAEAGPF